MERKEPQRVEQGWTANYLGHTITQETWDVNGRLQTVYVLDGAHAPTSHYTEAVHVKRAIRRLRYGSSTGKRSGAGTPALKKANAKAAKALAVLNAAARAEGVS